MLIVEVESVTKCFSRPNLDVQDLGSGNLFSSPTKLESSTLELAQLGRNVFGQAAQASNLDDWSDFAAEIINISAVNVAKREVKKKEETESKLKTIQSTGLA